MEKFNSCIKRRSLIGDADKRIYLPIGNLNGDRIDAVLNVYEHRPQIVRAKFEKDSPKCMYLARHTKPPSTPLIGLLFEPLMSSSASVHIVHYLTRSD